MNRPHTRLIVFETRNAAPRSLWIGVALCLSLCAGLPLCWSQDRSTARSMVITRQGIVATSHTLASQAGAQILARGGSAVDAAIAANAVLAVTEPMMCGIGGDLFVLYWEAKTGKLTGLNSSGWAPKALTPEYLSGNGLKAMPRDGIHSASVPGCVDGWSKMHAKFGRLPWRDLFAAATHYAAEGYPVPELIQAAWRNYETVPFFLPHGKPPAVGDIFVNHEMARAMKLLAEQGRDTFYRGDIAKAILSTSDRLGGTMTAADLAEFSSEWVEPVSVDYRGWKVFQLPPNGQGMAALQILNILENFPPSSQGQNSTEDLHRKIEAMKLAYADLYRYVADTRFVPVPLKELLSKPYAARRALLIDPDKANCDVKPGEPTSGDTTYLTVVDRQGNIASWIQSIAGAWGSRVLVDNMGFLLHNRGSGFSLDPKHPNFLAGRKRPFHTIIPAFMEKGDIHIGFGIMGGANQPLAHAQFASNFIDFGMNLQEALEAPRFTSRTRTGCAVLVETRISPRVLQELSAKGHQLDLRKEHSMLMGRGQAVLHDSRTKVNYGASDSRADGAAVPEPLP
jgi:gamma-glutamyltranspeptidase/glutathione hydrolase